MENPIEKQYDRIDRRILREIYRLSRLCNAQNREIQLIIKTLNKRGMRFEQVEMHDAISADIHRRSVATEDKINNLRQRLKALNRHFEKQVGDTKY
jgi:DNA-binding winged helix-turn-helix (wHTH) protein